MSDLFLGVIAGAVLVMAIIQVAAIVFAVRAARRVDDAVSRFEQHASRFEQHIRPIVANLQTLTSEAARATSAATAQLERASQMMVDLTRRVDETAATVQSRILHPVREGYSIFQGILAALAALRPHQRPAPKRPTPAEEEDALFIG